MEQRIVSAVKPEARSPGRVARDFLRRVEGGASLRPAGRARSRPTLLLRPPYLPRYELRLFDTRFFLADYRLDDSVGFFVAYVTREAPHSPIWPRILYKDSSLLWRVASHYVRYGDSVWIGKGDTRVEEHGDILERHTAEETTNMPFELQFALDEVSRRGPKRRDLKAIGLVARRGPPGRIEPYSDFSTPRRLAAAANSVNGGRPVARFLRKGDPTSLRFARGYEPDFARGILDRGLSASAYFGGRILKVRILSTNRRIQYLFLASPTHSWIGSPQLLSTELSTYGVRTLDVPAEEEAFLPGYEYHDEEDSQIPAGFAGKPHPKDPDRADASAWLEAMPVIRAFRAQVLDRPMKAGAPRRKA